ncbi:MAG: sulfatase-like hydrolase/transferase [Candidatus Tritonobacter lacicola]|nr:sulfatase-like hydrolase/transferase [Candidatus Tritonobacter lacicola]
MKKALACVDFAFRLALLAALVLFSVCFLVVALSRLAYPYEIEWNEGGILCHTMMALRGHPIYVAPNAGFFPWTYMPLYYYVLALISFFTGIHLWTGRCVSIISTLIIAYLVWRIVRRETANRQAGIVGASIFLAAYGITGFWYDIVRMDSMALALLLGGFYIIRFGEWKTQVVGALLLTLAIFSKQNLLVLFPFAILCAIFEGKRKAAAFTISLILFPPLLFGAFNIRTGGWFLNYTMGAPVSHGFTWAATFSTTCNYLVYRMPLFVLSFFILAIGATWTIVTRQRTRPKPTWLIAFLGAYLCYLVTLSHPGAYKNVVIPVVLFGAVLTGILWSFAASWKGVPGHMGHLILYGIMAFQLWLFRYDPWHQIPTRLDYEAGDALIERLREIDGDILMEYHPYYPMMAGKEPGFHHDALFDRYARGRRAITCESMPPDLLRKIQNKEYSAIILDEWPEYIDIRRLGKAIEENYVLAERLFPEGTPVFCTKTGWINRPDLLYRPKGPGTKELRKMWPLEGATGKDFIRIMDQFATNDIEAISSKQRPPEVVMRGGELRGTIMTGSERWGNDEYRLIYSLPNYGFLTDWVEVPSEAVLKFGIGFWKETAIKSHITAFFRLNAIDRSSNRTTLFEGSFNTHKVPEYGYQRWEKVGLGDFSGHQIRLEFTVTSENEGNPAVDWPVWIDPCIVYPSKEKEAARAQIEKTNVIIVLADAMRPDHLPCYGYGRDTAPNISELAARGVVFTNAFPQAPWTKPSVGSLFTGLYPYQHRALIAVDVPAYHEVPQLAYLSEDLKTLAETFRENGYRTAGFNTNVHLLRSLGFAQGFDYWADMDNISSPEVTEDAVRWINRNAPSPFFMYIHYMDTHSPYRTYPPYKGRFHGTPPDLEDRLLTEHELSELREGIPPISDLTRLSDLINIYDDAIAQIDGQVGKLVSLLENHGLIENTMVIFLADHGEALSEHGNYFHGWTLYNEMLRVPLVISCPGLLAGGKHVNGIVEIRNIFPTVIDLLDLKTYGAMKYDIKPSSLKNLLAESRDAVAGQAYSETEVRIRDKPLRVHSALSCIQNNRWKLVHDFRTGRSDLYDLETDPWETKNLYGKHPAIEENMGRILKERGSVVLAPVKDDLLPESGYRSIVNKKLRALGYLR